MKRRLFLKNGGLGIASIAIAPTFFRDKCKPDPTGSGASNPFLAEGMQLFSEGAEFFDLGVAELRIAENGSFGAAEAEAYDLTQVVEQIYQQAEAQAELPIDFAESAQEVMDASAELVDAAPELVPIPRGGHAELAENFAFLKVLKATAVLHSAAEADPFDTRREVVAEKMFGAAQDVYVSLEGTMAAESGTELIESTEALLAYSEEYVGTAESLSGLIGFENALDEYNMAESQFAGDLVGAGAAHLFAASENLAMSAEYHVEGLYNLNAEAELFGSSAAEIQAEELFPFLSELVAETEGFANLAQGEAAELGAAEMLFGAEVMRDTAASDATELFWGGEAFELGAEQYLAGTLNFYGSESYETAAAEYFTGAESIKGGSRNGYSEGLLTGGASMLYKASESVFVSAEALEFISGEYLVIESPEVITSGSETIEIVNAVYSGGENPEVINLRGNSLELISPDPIEFISPESFELGGETFNLSGAPEITAEATDAVFVYPNGELGTANLQPATAEVSVGAELLESMNQNVETMEGSFEMMEGAEYALEGAIEMMEMPEFIQDGGQHIEDGGFELMNGAMELVEGL